jgi:hypothetical protein
MASFMALAPERSAKRAMALSERWSDRFKITTYRCPANGAHPHTGQWEEKVARRSPTGLSDKYLTWPNWRLLDGTHTNPSGG